MAIIARYEATVKEPLWVTTDNPKQSRNCIGSLLDAQRAAVLTCMVRQVMGVLHVGHQQSAPGDTGDIQENHRGWSEPRPCSPSSVREVQSVFPTAKEAEARDALTHALAAEVTDKVADTLGANPCDPREANLKSCSVPWHDGVVCPEPSHRP
jgi:hypothetical protein